MLVEPKISDQGAGRGRCDSDDQRAAPIQGRFESRLSAEEASHVQSESPSAASVS